VHPVIKMLFLNSDAVFQDENFPIHTAGRAWRWTSAFSLPSTITKFEHHWTTVVSFWE
jgi:hypothetical protein